MIQQSHVELANTSVNEDEHRCQTMVPSGSTIMIRAVQQLVHDIIRYEGS